MNILELCRNLSSRIITEPNLPGVHHTPLGGNLVQTAWRASHTAKRQAPAESSLHRHRLADYTLLPGASLSVTAWRTPLASPGAMHHRGFYCTIPPGGKIPTVRRSARTVIPVTGSCPVRLVARPCCQAPYQ